MSILDITHQYDIIAIQFNTDDNIASLSMESAQKLHALVAYKERPQQKRETEWNRPSHRRVSVTRISFFVVDVFSFF